MKKFITKLVAAILLFSGLVFGSLMLPTTPVYADPVETAPEESPTEDNDEDESGEEGSKTTSEEDQDPVCTGQSGSVSWILCPVLNMGSNIVTEIYGFIEELLVVKPLTTDTESATYKVWETIREITNIVFVGFIVIVIYSQITGFGISNYGVKRVLPRLIISVILVNLSYFMSSAAVDVSNLAGSSITNALGDIHETVRQSILDSGVEKALVDVDWTTFIQYFLTGSTALGLAFAATKGIGGVFWMLALALLGAVISVGIGIVTISLRQGLVSILIMIAPLAFVAYLLPNTEGWFTKWKNLFFQMIFFFPMFSLLFGTANLAGSSLIWSAEGSLWLVLIGLAVKVLPLCLAISMLKMSGTILGKVSNALDRLSNPARGGIDRWAESHANRAREAYLRRNIAPGAKLRNYLARRQAYRDARTENDKRINTGRASTYALERLASSRGFDTEGNMRNRRRPSSATRMAKLASLQDTITSNAQQNLNNTLSEYGDVFAGRAASKLSGRHADAFVDSVMQQFRAENIAQGDQSYLLQRYLNAAKDQHRSPYEYNRFIHSAAGSLGHLGEATIMGQVIDRSVQIENRRRREAITVANKFGFKKSDFRGMIMDKNHINDNGIEENEDGVEIEDSMYRLKPGREHEHKGWQQYIAVHKTTNKEITKEAYDALSAQAKLDYRKVRYIDINDDENDTVQRVFEDDAGYMKELLRKDIMIGDPINRRYLTEIGLKHFESDRVGLVANYAESTGKLRKYHSTITAAMQEARYSEHDAAVTAMLLAQADAGYITDPSQFNIAALMSMWKAAKSGKLLQNDAIILKQYKQILSSIDSTTDGQKFEDFFSDAGVALFRSVNEDPLKGMRMVMDEFGHVKWKEISRNDPTITLEDKKNFLKHKVIPETAKKFIGMATAVMSSNIADSQKPDTTLELYDAIDVLLKQAENNLDSRVPFEQRMNPEIDIMQVKDGSRLRNEVERKRDEIYERLGIDNPNHPTGDHEANDDNRPFNSSDTNNNGGYYDVRGNGRSQQRSGRANDGVPYGQGHSSLFDLNDQVEGNQQYEDHVQRSNNIAYLVERVNDIFALNGSNIKQICAELQRLVDNNDTLREYRKIATDMISRAYNATAPKSQADVVNPEQELQNRITELKNGILSIIYSISNI